MEVRLRPLSFASVSLKLIAAALFVASPAAAGTLDPPCSFWKPCAPVVGPWLTTGDDDSDDLYPLECPPGQAPNYERAVASDGVVSGPANPYRAPHLVGTQTGGGAGVGARGLVFGLHDNPANVRYRPGIGCGPLGATVASVGQEPRTAGAYRVRVRKVRIHPGDVVRVRRGCAGGERLAHSGSVVAFFTRRPPSRPTVRAIKHRHRRAVNVSRTFVVTPAGVGDDERVELQVTALCMPARKSVAAQTASPNPCLAFTSCTAAIGPWVSVNGNEDGTDMYSIRCPAPPGEYRRAIGSDVAIANVPLPGLYIMLIMTSGGLGPGAPGLEFGLFDVDAPQKAFSYQPAVGCLPRGACVIACRTGMFQGVPFGGADGSRSSYRKRVRSVRIRPGATARVRLGCARGERLVHSGYGVGFFTSRPPSPLILEALKQRHRRAGRLVRTFVSAPPGVGDDERVELQVTTICARAG
jgi:hypothetical protein